MKSKSKTNSIQNKDLKIIAGITAVILAVPFIGMQISGEWNWSLLDFVSIGVLVAASGLLVAFVTRRIKKTSHRTAVIAVIIAVLLLTCIHLAVGIVDTWPLAGS